MKSTNIQSVKIVTHKSLAIILNIRSQMVTFFFGIIEDSDLPPIIGWEVRDQYPADYMDYDLTDKQVYVTSLKVLNRRAKEKDFQQTDVTISNPKYKFWPNKQTIKQTEVYRTN